MTARLTERQEEDQRADFQHTSCPLAPPLLLLLLLLLLLQDTVVSDYDYYVFGNKETIILRYSLVFIFIFSSLSSCMFVCLSVYPSASVSVYVCLFSPPAGWREDRTELSDQTQRNATPAALHPREEGLV